MGQKLGMRISLVYVGLSGSRDLTLDCTIWIIFGRKRIVELIVRVLGSCGLRVVLLLPCFGEGGVGE